MTSLLPGADRVRRLFGHAPLPLPTGAEAASFDRRATEDQGVPAAVLMENAGRSAALVVQHLAPRGPIRVFVGSGNNGGDGVVLARTLHALGRDVSIVAIGARDDPDPLLHGHSLPVRAGPGALEVDPEDPTPSVVVDALLGTGIQGAPRALHDQAIERIARLADQGALIASLDIPSGVDSATGRLPGAAVQADVTLAFGAPKLGTLLHPGRARSGRLIALEIGFPPWTPEDAAAELITPALASSLRPRRALQSHKKAEGRLLLIGGAPGMSGALVIAARAALRAGAGYLRLAVGAEDYPLFHAAVPEAVLVDADDPSAVADAAADSDAIAAGPGLGRGARADTLRTALQQHDPGTGLLLDADALRLAAAGQLPGIQPDDSDPLDPDAARYRLLTPHPGEASALIDRSSGDIVADPCSAARALAARWGATVLLKGTPSVVAAPDRAPVRVSSSGSSEFARAGMGDLLTGVAGTLMARGLPASDAAALALHWTGRAADRLALGDALLPTDLPDALPFAMAEEGPGRTDLPHPFVLLDLPRAH